jgi:hypothetical protein
MKLVGLALRALSLLSCPVFTQHLTAEHSFVRLLGV